MGPFEINIQQAPFTLQEFGSLFFLLAKDGIVLRFSWCLGRFLR